METRESSIRNTAGLKRKHLIQIGLVTAIFGVPGSVFAQDGASDRVVLPPPEAAPPAAQGAPPEAAPPDAASTPAAVSGDPGPDDVPGKHKGHGKHKKRGLHRGHGHSKGPAEPGKDTAGDRETASTFIAGPAAEGTLVFTSSGGSLQLKGRVMALSELSHRSETVVSSNGGLTTRDVNALDLSLASARVGLEYRSPLRWLSAELELEISGRPEVKDAYVLAGKRFFAKAGQFKVPTASLELESPWTLPLARRGLIHDLLTDWLDVAGRRPGLALGYRGKGPLKPRLTLGAFQGTTMSDVAPGDRDVELIEQASMKAQSLAARAELTLVGVDFGAWYEHRVASRVIGEFERLPVFGVDATLDRTFDSGGLRAWLDGGGGKSLYVHADKPDTDEDPLFLLGRALIAYRFGGVTLGAPYVEPFGFFGLLDPDTEVVADFATETALGVNAGYWDRCRLTLQAEMTRGQRNFPKGFLDNQDPDRLSLLLQAGARF